MPITYTIDLNKMELSSSDGCRCNLYEAGQRTIVEIVEPGGKYKAILDGAVEWFANWREFMSFIGIAV